MNKKENRMAVRQTVEKAVIRDEQNRRIQSAATNPVKRGFKKSFIPHLGGWKQIPYP